MCKPAAIEDGTCLCGEALGDITIGVDAESRLQLDSLQGSSTVVRKERAVLQQADLTNYVEMLQA